MRNILIIFVIGLFISDGLSQSLNKQDRFVVKVKHIDFTNNDSVMNYTVFIEPTGYFYFREGLIYDLETITYRFNKKGKSTKDSVFFDIEDKLKIENFMGILIKDSTSFKNHYSDSYSFIPFINELSYSYILTNLTESKLSQKSGEKVLRLIIPNETSGTERDYYSIRVDFNNRYLVYKMGSFNNNLDYELSRNDSVSLSDKQIDKIISILEQVDFNGVKYFTEVGLNFYPTYLIEYFNGSDYFVFEKQLLSRNKGDTEFNRLISEILMIKNKVIPKN